ncbi:MAG: hypothetical protein H6827_09785 [Planctomycetes bacterium]|nr:hypothetical protein [Planctomycetota bacterium]
MPDMTKADLAHALRNSACAYAAEGASLLAVDAILDASDILTEGLDEILFPEREGVLQEA